MRIRVAALVVLALALPVVVAAQGGDDLKALRQEIESLKTSIGAVQRDVQEIKTLLQGATRAAGPPPPVVPDTRELSVANAYTKGGAGAPPPAPGWGGRPLSPPPPAPDPRLR